MADPVQEVPEQPIVREKVRRQVESELVKLGSYYGTANAEQRLNITSALILLNSALIVKSDTRAMTLLQLAKRNARMAVLPKPRRVAPAEYVK